MPDKLAKVAPIVANAKRLLADAKIMFEAKSYRTATALAVLSIEEMGKACLVYWKLHGFEFLTSNQIVKATHIQKQRVLSAYYFYTEAKPIMDAGLKDMTGEHLIATMNGVADSKYRLIEFVTKTGSFDTVKQLGFYVDLDDDLTPFTLHEEMGEVDATQQIQEAEVAVAMMDLGKKDHFFIAIAYEFGEENPPFPSPAKARRNVMKLYEEGKKPPHEDTVNQTV
ncbi:MAG: AbiV family abortive infection protein [Alphaproteobacteria bacterium]|nr:AbiV family abortive infection protein [Rhizobiaceae bacterium]MBU3959865.1 AbiV family abortive infection protein [Alphaproteobacteria bacterium]MBU4050822.1 AbiV family abortive infection protein [Alphaproteobacteria bacterium]MBU4087219.1 AbiV family abortive infection protein [Alphaproteobacteria bacterium]MBU4155543.1 AbiV family abortive infection protein [Alphaproteobacteria bacterium]